VSKSTEAAPKVLTNSLERKRPRTEAALHYCDVADPTMKVGAVLRLHALEASRDKLNSWKPGVFVLRQTGHTGVATLRAA
jgi:hypothetical protein